TRKLIPAVVSPLAVPYARFSGMWYRRACTRVMASSCFAVMRSAPSTHPPETAGPILTPFLLVVSEPMSEAVGLRPRHRPRHLDTMALCPPTGSVPVLSDAIGRRVAQRHEHG